MIERPANADEGAGSDRPEFSELFRTLVLEIDDAVAQGTAVDLPRASLTGLSAEEAARLGEAHRCLELLYRCRHATGNRGKAAKTTVLLEACLKAVAPHPDALDDEDPAETKAEGKQPATHRGRLGRFEVVRELGRGGQGIVFLVRDPRLNRQLALKVPRPEFLLSSTMRRRFVREGHAAAILTHPNIVTVFEAGEIGPICYLAQVYVAGPTLAEWHELQPGPIPVRTASAIAAALADGVEYAHARGVLHRDLKPSNVLLDSGQVAGRAQGPRSLFGDADLPFVPRITDFGVARMRESDGHETVTGTILGTAAYMSPEQAAGRFRELDAAADVYSLGAILYELLTGFPVFHGDTLLDTLRLVATVEPIPPRKLRRDVPRDLEAICLKCLEKEPKARYASAFDLAADLRRFLAHEPTRVRPPHAAERLVRWCRRKPTLSALTALLATALFALIGHIFWSQSRLQQLVIEANQGRQRAEYHEKLANQNKEWALRRERSAQTMAYAADLRLVAESWDTSSGPALAALLEAHVPSEGSPDVRGFEWWLYHKLLNEDTPSKELGTHKGGVESVAVSPRGDLAASGGADGIIRLWHLDAGSAAGELRGHALGHVSGLAFSPDGSRLASAGDDRTVRVWDVGQRKELFCLSGHAGWVSAVTFLGGNATLASGGEDRTVLVWDLASGAPMRRISGHSDTVRTLAFCGKHRVLYSAAEDGTVRAWDIDKGTPSPLYSGGQLENSGGFWMRCLSLGPDENMLLGVPFADKPVIVWDLRPGHAGKQHPLPIAGNPRCASIQGAPTAPVVAFGLEDSNVRVHPYGAPDNARVLRGHRQTVDAVALAPDGKTLVSGSQDGGVRLWNLRGAGRVIQRLNFAERIFAVAINPNGTRVAVSRVDGETTLLDFQSLNVLRRIRPPGRQASAMAFSPDSASLATISTGEPLRLYSSSERPKEIDIPGTTGISRISFSPDGRLVAIGDGSTLIVVDVVRGVIVARRSDRTTIRDAAFIDDDSIVTSSHGGDLCRWSLRDDRERTCARLQAGELHTIAISPDLRYGAVRGFHQVKIFDPVTLVILASLPAHDEVGDLCFLAGGRTLLVGDISTRPCLWQTTTWHRMGLLETDSIFAAKASLDGYRLVGAQGKLLTTIDARLSEEADRSTRND